MSSQSKKLTIPLYPISLPRAIPFAQLGGICTSVPKSGALTPKAIKNAYGFPPQTNLSRIKIACIEAFQNDTLENDLQVFAEYFGIKNANVTAVFPFGKSKGQSERWKTESALDVQWLNALAESADIYCVFSPTDEFEYMFRTVKYAAEQLKCSIIIMSFGTREFLSQSQMSEYFSETSDTMFICAAGDYGGNVFFPSASQGVLSVGGSSVALSERGLRMSSETAWSLGGGGPSKYEKIPAFQSVFDGISDMSGGFRATPDVCFAASYNPGVSIYISSSDLDGNTMCGWNTTGGTSFSAVALGAVAAHLKKSSKELYGNNLQGYLYALAGGTKYDKPQYFFYDVTSGSNGRYSAKAGWDFCTGLGSPVVKQIIEG